MNTPVDSPPRPSVLAATILVAVALSCWAAWWLTERHHALQVLREEAAYGLQCLRIESGKERPFPGAFGWKCYCPGVGPTLVHIEYALPRGARLGTVLRHFGTLTDITFGQGDLKEVDRLFAQLGRQDHLRNLYLFGPQVPDNFCGHLARYTGLINIGISPSDISGEQMPLLPRLENLELAYAPISDAGFGRLLALPSLKSLSLDAPMITAKGLEEVLRIKRVPETITIGGTGTYFTNAQAKPILEAFNKKWPQALLEVD